MPLCGLVTALVLSACGWMLVLAAEQGSPAVTPAKPVTAAVTPPGNNSSSPASNSTAGGGHLSRSFVDSKMIQRALYVLIGTTVIGLLYFLIRAVRLKKPAPKKKYGLLSDYDDSVEMEGVESEEDDTLYEARGLRR